jgi:putative ABC transport system substrate-binding protein
MINKNLVRFILPALFLTLGSPAQTESKIPRVGILFMGGRDQPHLEDFKQGLTEHGYSEGKNILLEYRYAEGKYERLPELAMEFVREKVDVIVTTSSESAQAARKATRTIPIVVEAPWSKGWLKASPSRAEMSPA